MEVLDRCRSAWFEMTQIRKSGESHPLETGHLKSTVTPGSGLHHLSPRKRYGIPNEGGRRGAHSRPCLATMAKRGAFLRFFRELGASLSTLAACERRSLSSLLSFSARQACRQAGASAAQHAHPSRHAAHPGRADSTSFTPSRVGDAEQPAPFPLVTFLQ